MKVAARLALALLLGAVLSPTHPAAAAPVPPVAAFTLLGQWPAGYVGSITVGNLGTVPVEGWRVEFDLAAGTRITSSYSGVFTRSGDHYTVTNAAWNGTIAPGGSATFGWVAAGSATPVNCTVNGSDCAGVPADHRPPSRPGPLEFDITAGLTLTWAPSADDAGPVRYEVYESDRLLATVTDTRYVYSSGATLPPRIYIFAVRAVDAAGNPSPSAYRSLGQIWRGDEIPPAPADLRVDTPAPGLRRLAWTGPPAQSPFAAPPVAGYEVYLDGEPVGQTGGTSLIIAAPPAGSHTYGVRSINAVDRHSPMAELTVPDPATGT